MVMRKDELEALARQLQVTQDPDERETLKRTFVKGVEARSPGVATALSELSNASSLVGEDLTGLHSLYGQQKIEPLSPDAVRSSLDEATRKAPWWRRASARALGAIEWWQKEVTEPSSALTLATAFKLTPGEQPYDRKIEKARRELAVQQGQAARVDGLSQYVDAATEAYRSTKLPFGTKGFMELVADPLNLIGWGLPAKAGRALPALKPIMFPLRIIDEAPDQLAKRLISVPTSGIKVSARAAEIFTDLKPFVGKGIPGLKDIPGVSALGKPHLTTQAREAQSRAYASMSELFGNRIADPNPAVTQELLSDLSRFPQDAGPYSVRNLLNHLADTMGYDAWFGREGSEGFADKLNKLTPKEASETISALVFGAELKAIREGGTKVSGEVVEGIRPRRVKAVSGLLQKLHDDDRWAQGVATGIDGFLHKFETVYVKKVEPLISRPLALSHLAFTAFPIQNIFEDLGMAAVGLGASPFGVNDALFRTLTAGLDVPAHLLDNERLAVTAIGGGDRFLTGSKMVTILSLFFNKINAKIAKYAWGIRRSSLTNLFNKEFGKALRQAGMSEADLNSLRQLVEEIPPEARQIAEDIGVMAWLGISTGSPDAIRSLRQVVSSRSFIQRKQSGLLAEFPNIVDEARDLIRQTIFKEGGVSRGNVEQVRVAVRAKLLDWHRLTSEDGIQSSYGDAIRAIAERPARTPEEAQAQIAWLQWASDSLASLPNEIRRNAYLRAQSFPPASPARQRAFQEADALTGNIIPKLEADFRASVERVRTTSRGLIGEITKTPAQREVVIRSLDEVFDSYSTISKSVAETRAESARINEEMFGATSPADRDEAFWLERQRRQDVVWQREHEIRRRQLNIARTGWNSIFDVVKPSQLTPKGREFMKAGVRSMLGNAEENLDEIAGELRKLQAQPVPESVAAEHARRIEELKKDLLVADQHTKQLRRELENFGQVRASTQPQELTQYDDAIGLLMREIDYANKVGLSQHIGPLQQKLTQALNEREASFLRIIPDYAKPRYQALLDQRTAVLAAPVRDEKGLRKIEREINRFRNSITSGEAGKFAEEVTQVTDVAALRAADKLLAETGNVLPNTLDEAIEVLGRLADNGDEDILNLLNALESNVGTQRDVFERIYTRAAQRSNTAQIQPLEKQVLRDITTTPDRIPDSVTVRLTQSGALRAGARLSSGKVRFEITDFGKQVLDQVPDTNLNVDEILSQLPEPRQRFESSADALLADVDSLLDRAVAISDAPPLLPGDEAKVGRYFDKVADELARDPARLEKLKVARQVAWKRAKSEYNRFFIDYDNRSTLDYFMQRLMPFWMYEQVPTESTRILTKSGWKTCDEVVEGEMVLTLSMKTGKSHWEPLLRKNIDLVIDKEMTSFQRRGVEIISSDRHRWPVITKDGLRFKTTPELRGRGDFVPTTAVHDSWSSKSVLSDRDAALLGWIYTDGYMRHSYGKFQNAVIYQSSKKYLREIVELVGTDTQGVYRHITDTDFSVYLKPEISRRLYTLCPTRSDFLSLIPQLSQSAAEAMWTAMWKAEGCNTDGRFTQKPGPVSDAFQMLSVLLGKSISVDLDRFERINILQGDRKEVRSLRRIKHTGRMWCPTTPSETWLMNYNGRVMFTGNSRRWPRLISLAAKRPVLGKYMVQLGTDWDYGYQPTPWGMEFNPAKGLIVGGLRRTLSRDYPEFHQGWRGKFEEGTDWLARGGFYFAPPISGAFDVISGQPGNILPPPINLVLHGLAGAAGGSVPEPLQTLTYNGRYINFLTDQVLADKFKANPVEVRRGVEDGDPDATAKMDLARRDASARYIAIQQSAMLRYRPQSKRQYIEDTSAAVEELVGVSKAEQDNLRRLGIPLYSVVPVSGFQRKAIREAIPNYDAWIAANNSLRPVEEQKAMRIIDEFWQEQERVQTDFEKQMADLSTKWETNEISGPEAREELSVLQRERANAFQRLKDHPRYAGTVPLTPDERLAWAQRHGSPAPLIHPVDEILERYYAITPDRHVDPLTGDTDWGAFFEERESVLADYPPQVSDIARTVLRSKNTPMERTLEASKTALRTYFGIRGSLSEELAERDPGASAAYQTYRQLAIAEKKLVNYPREQLAIRRQMREIMRHEPELQRLERRVRLIRQDLRRNDPDIATAYGLWVSSPQTTPRVGGLITPRRTSRSIRTI